MFRSSISPRRKPCRFPHTRGDVPVNVGNLTVGGQFSPHAWGCSVGTGRRKAGLDVFPTRVGMFLAAPAETPELMGFPHTRGDVPSSGIWSAIWGTFSPHAWGCSVVRHRDRVRGEVFPTRVGMFRFHANARLALQGFSPHAWGYSQIMMVFACARSVFPTRVGMFRNRRISLGCCTSFPHTRGDVPTN